MFIFDRSVNTYNTLRNNKKYIQVQTYCGSESIEL
jgi:hypothetical protein